MNTQISIVIAVLNSHEVVRRQCLYFRKMPLPDDVELILVDDKSDPPLNAADYDLPRLRIFRHEIPAAWTQPAARNYGVKQATGEFLICTDVDHIIPLDLINVVREGRYDWIKFVREVAVLDENGDVVQTPEAVLAYGYEPHRLRKRGFVIPPHTNSFAIRRQLYLDCGGVSEHRVGSGKHPNREEIPLRRKLHPMAERGEITLLDAEEPNGDQRPKILMIPNGRYCGDKDYNPFGLFHNLQRKTREEYSPPSSMATKPSTVSPSH